MVVVLAKKKRVGKEPSADSMFILTIGAIVTIVLIVSLTILALTTDRTKVTVQENVAGDAYQLSEPVIPEPGCMDSDNGKNYREKGYVATAARSSRHNDVCINGFILKEWFCQDGNPEYNYVNCNALLGLSCIDGRCK
ncbi:MAG: hypothetical protein ABIJ21_01565 [Nanoarchaeota archaeon]